MSDYGLPEHARAKAIEIVAGAAHSAASVAFAGMNPKDRAGETQNTWWYADGQAVAGETGYDDLAAVDRLAGFQFGKAAIGETLFRQAAYDQLHPFAGDSWPDQPARVRLAYEIFAAASVSAFQMLGAEHVRANPPEAAGFGLTLDAQSAEKIGEELDDQHAQDPHAVAALKSRNRKSAAEKRAEKAAKEQAKVDAAAEAEAAREKLTMTVQAAGMIVRSAIGRDLAEGEGLALVKWLEAQPAIDLHKLEDKATALIAIGVLPDTVSLKENLATAGDFRLQVGVRDVARLVLALDVAAHLLGRALNGFEEVAVGKWAAAKAQTFDVTALLDPAVLHEAIGAPPVAGTPTPGAADPAAT